MLHHQHSIQALKSLKIRSLLLLGGAACAISFAAPAQAQDDEDTARKSDTIVVTAQRREQSIDDVGISVTAFSGDQLSKQGITDTRGLAAQTPGLIFDGGSGQGLNAFVTIRGVAQTDYTEHQEMPNAVYLDDVYVPTTSMVGFPVYDMERAEALRGPQGTLFGRNSTGGLLHFITRDPGEEINGFVDGRYGNYDRFWVEGAVGGPISENLSFRIAGFRQDGDGYVENKNTTPGEDADGFEQNAYGVRIKLRADFNNDWSATATGSLNRSPRHVEGVYKTLPGFVDAGGVARVLPEDMVIPVGLQFFGPVGPGVDPLGYRDPFDDFHQVAFNSQETFIEKRFDYATLKIVGPISDSITFTSLTNYSKSKINYSEDADSTPNQYFNFRTQGETRQLSQEIRLNGEANRLNWTAGAFFLDIDGTYGTDFDFVAFDTLYPNRYTQDTQSWAIFGQLEYDLSDRLTATIGGRYTHDKRNFESVAFEIFPGCEAVWLNPECQNYDFTRAAVGDLTESSYGDFAGKVALDFQASENVLLYVSASRGIRGPGFNATADGYLPIENTTFTNEVVHAFETGIKAGMFDGRANLRASAFYYDYNDFQAFNFNGLTNSVTNNDAYFTGGEVELYTNPMEGLDINLGVAFLEAEVKDVDAGFGLVDTDPIKAPKWTFNGSVAKEFVLGDFQLNVQYDFDFIDKHKANLAFTEITNIDSSWWHNARIGYGQEQNGWEVYVFVHNLANVDRKTFGYDNTFAGLALSSFAPPRMYGVGFRKDF